MLAGQFVEELMATSVITTEKQLETPKALCQAGGCVVGMLEAQSYVNGLFNPDLLSIGTLGKPGTLGTRGTPGTQGTLGTREHWEHRELREPREHPGTREH